MAVNANKTKFLILHSQNKKINLGNKSLIFRVGNLLIGFLSESLSFLQKMSDLSDPLMVTLFW